MNQPEQWPPAQGGPRLSSQQPGDTSAGAPRALHPPVPGTTPSAGKGWWRANAALYVVSALLFGLGVAACVHWVRRSDTEAFAAANPHVAKYQAFYALAVLGLACLAALAATLAVFGACSRRPGPPSAAALMVPCVLVAQFSAFESIDEFTGSRSFTSGHSTLLTVGSLALSAAAVLVASLASNTAVRRSPRPRRQRPEDMVRRQYPGRPPYPPPPGR